MIVSPEGIGMGLHDLAFMVQRLRTTEAESETREQVLRGGGDRSLRGSLPKGLSPEDLDALFCIT